MFKKLIQNKLESYVKRYFKAHPEVKLVIVAGSVGKTTTRNAIASVLSQRFRVRMEPENHNTEISAPLAILGIELPEKLRSPLAWYNVFQAAQLRVSEPADVDVIIQEIGVDHPGEMKHYGRYLHGDIGLVTAVAPEHMEFFQTLDVVAREELSVTEFCYHTLINRDDIDDHYAELLTNANFSTYGSTGSAEYHIEMTDQSPRQASKGLVSAPEFTEAVPITVPLIGEHSMRPMMGAVATALKLGMTKDEVIAGVEQIQPVPGRMNPLHGLDDSIIIDDSYNSSPSAAASALQSLYRYDTEPQRIAVLGSMNELGETSAEEHKKLGELCNPDLLAWVVVVGEDAANHLAPAAKQRGCQVKVCQDAIEAGQFVRSVMEPGAVILVKGSQGDVYLEETVKILCDISEHDKLVRQSPRWIEIKNQHFSRFRDN